MIPSAFDYQRPASLDQALQALADNDEDAKLMAGGHSLLPLMKLRLAAPSVIIDIGRLDELNYIKEAGDRIAIGALTRHHTVEASDLLDREVPLLAHATGKVGDPQVRHRGTIGGAIAHGDPASDLPAVMLALNATFTVVGPGGERQIEANDFFEGFLETTLADNEILTEICVPKSAGAGWSFQKFNRRAQDWAIVGVAAIHNGTTGVGLVNMGSTPVRAAATEEALAGGASAAEAAAKAADGLDPPADLNASVEYRQHLAQVLVRRALEEAGVS
ncbi:MAG: xanthine dehydrogenase family protein subunit M [Actinomycetota bacterium]|nr:xanthine dehydrogenase family protein subunit M [Actinomycetota bacterium]